MQSTDRPEFDSGMKVLFAALDKPATAERLEAFWVSCRRMSLLEFIRARDELLREFSDGVERKSFQPGMIWAALKTLKAAGASTTKAPSMAPGCASIAEYCKSVNEQLRQAALSEPAKHPGLTQALDYNYETWRQMHAANPEHTRLKHQIAQCAMVLAREREGTPLYEMALQREREVRMQLLALEKRQAEEIAAKQSPEKASDPARLAVRHVPPMPDECEMQRRRLAIPAECLRGAHIVSCSVAWICRRSAGSGSDCCVIVGIVGHVPLAQRLAGRRGLAWERRGGRAFPRRNMLGHLARGATGTPSAPARRPQHRIAKRRVFTSERS